MKINKKTYNADIQKDALCCIDNYYKVLRMECKNVKKRKWDMQYKQNAKALFEKYKIIKLIKIEFHAFGEALIRCYSLYQDIKEKKKDELYVVLPCFYYGYRGTISNKRMLDLFEEYILPIKETNIDFWKYILLYYFDKINTTTYFSYIEKREGTPYTNIGNALIEFSKNIKKEAEEKFENLQIKDPFVCIHARDKGCTKLYLNKTESYVREYDIYSLKKSCEEMIKLGIQPVRMGKFEERTLDINGVVDYAGLYHDDLLDFYLSSKCKFMIGTNSGMSQCPPFFGRPLLRVNAFGDNLCYEMIAVTDYDMYIPKKLWFNKENRYLNLKECLDMHEYCMLQALNYRVNGIVVVDNTEEEIWEAVKEMNSKIDGTWIVSEDEIECYKKYNEVIKKWKSKRNSINMRKLLRWRGFTMPAIPICYSYLKNNRYLLEDI